MLIDCFLFSGNALSCKETFSLLYYEFDAVTREPPPWDAESYKMMGKCNSPVKIDIKRRKISQYLHTP